MTIQYYACVEGSIENRPTESMVQEKEHISLLVYVYITDFLERIYDLEI